MSKNLYVGNLPYSTTASDLESAFSRFGNFPLKFVDSKLCDQPFLSLFYYTF